MLKYAGITAFCRGVDPCTDCWLCLGHGKKWQVFLPVNRKAVALSPSFMPKLYVELMRRIEQGNFSHQIWDMWGKIKRLHRSWGSLTSPPSIGWTKACLHQTGNSFFLSILFMLLTITLFLHIVIDFNSTVSIYKPIQCTTILKSWLKNASDLKVIPFAR